MSKKTPRTAREQDYVFNDETCRALRQKGCEAARVFVPAFTVLVFFSTAAFLGVLSIFEPQMESVVGVILSVVFTVILYAEIRWFDISLDRKDLRKMKRDLIREARATAGDPEVIESRVLTENNKPNARPELAFGLPPEDCLMISVVLVLGALIAISASEAMTSVLLLAGSVGLSSALFAFAKHEQPNTYPPEEPPHNRD